MFKKRTSAFIRKGASPNVTLKSRVLKAAKLARTPTVNARSAIRFTTLALIAALFALRRVNQKLIKRYEHRPTPSQPKKRPIKLSAVISSNLKKVKRER